MSNSYHTLYATYGIALTLLTLTVCLHFKKLVPYRMYNIFPIAWLNETVYYLTGYNAVYDLLFPCIQSLLYLTPVRQARLPLPYATLYTIITVSWATVAFTGRGHTWHLLYYFTETASLLTLYTYFILKHLRKHNDLLLWLAALYILYDKLLDACFHLINYTDNAAETLPALQNGWIITQAIFTCIITGGIFLALHQKKKYA